MLLSMYIQLPIMMFIKFNIFIKCNINNNINNNDNDIFIVIFYYWVSAATVHRGRTWHPPS